MKKNAPLGRRVLAIPHMPAFVKQLVEAGPFGSIPGFVAFVKIQSDIGTALVPVALLSSSTAWMYWYLILRYDRPGVSILCNHRYDTSETRLAVGLSAKSSVRSLTFWKTRYDLSFQTTSIIRAYREGRSARKISPTEIVAMRLRPKYLDCLSRATQ